MILTTRAMLAKQQQRRRDSKLSDLDDDANLSNPEYHELYLDIPNGRSFQSFPSPSPALLEFCSDCDIELLLPSPVDTPRRRESGNEEDTDFEELWRLRSATWEASDVIEDEEDEDTRRRFDKDETTLWHARALNERYQCEDKADTIATTTIYVQPPTPEQRPESPDEFESTSQCATPRAQSFVNLAELNTSPSQSAGPPSPVTSRYAPQRGGPKSLLAPQSPKTSVTTSWTADLVDRTKQARSTVGDSTRGTLLCPTKSGLDTVARILANEAVTQYADGTIAPNPTPKNAFETPTKRSQEVEVRSIADELAQALEQEAEGREQCPEDPAKSPGPHDLVSMSPKLSAKNQKEEHRGKNVY